MYVICTLTDVVVVVVVDVSQLIPPPRTHHCRLCRKCYAECDHHCLFLYRCVAKHTHRLFLIFLLYTAALMLTFVYMALQYVQLLYPEQPSYQELLFLAFDTCPAIFFLALANVASACWLISLVYFQFWIISRNMTTAYRPNQGRTKLTRSQRYMNVVRFLLNSPRVEEPKPVMA